MKKCIICSQEAIYCIKDTTDYYCQNCAEENFGDITYLQKIEEQTAEKLVNKKLNPDNEDLEQGNN